MRTRLFFAAMITAGSLNSSFAKPLVCPANMPTTAAVAAGEISPLATIENPIDRAAVLARIVATMRDRGIASSGIIDTLISAYCPIVAANTSLTDRQKTADVRGFAAQAARAAYAFEDADEIILDIALPPGVASTVNAKAKQDRMTPQEWAATAVINAAKSPR